MKAFIYCALLAGFLGTLLFAFWERYLAPTRGTFSTVLWVLGVPLFIGLMIATEEKNAMVWLSVAAVGILAYALVLWRAAAHLMRRDAEPMDAEQRWRWLPQIICSGAIIAGLTGLLVVYSHGTEMDQQVKEFEPRFEALQAKVRQCLAQLPREGTLPEGPLPKLSPQPKPNQGNIVYASATGLRDGELPPDNRFEAVFGKGQDWSASLHKWRPEHRENAGDLQQMRSRCELVLGAGYLVVVRVLRWDEPEVNEEKKHYVPGRAQVEVFLFSLEGPRLLASLPVSAAGEPSIRFGGFGSSAVSAREAAERSLHDELKKAVVSRLREVVPDWPELSSRP
jgi:hypothetical protein